MASLELNGYNLSRWWFKWYATTDKPVSSFHTAFFFFIINHWNSIGQLKNFGLPSDYTVTSLKINYKTYLKIYSDLCQWGIIKEVQKSKNQYTANVICLSVSWITNDIADSIGDSISNSITDSTSNGNIIEYKNNKNSINNINKRTKANKLSLDEFRGIIDHALSQCVFTEKFTEQIRLNFYEWAKTENKVSALRKIKTELPKYFQKEIDYLDKKYASNQIDYIVELASRKSYVGWVEDKVPEAKRFVPPMPKELYSTPQPPPQEQSNNSPDEFILNGFQ